MIAAAASAECCACASGSTAFTILHAPTPHPMQVQHRLSKLASHRGKRLGELRELSAPANLTPAQIWASQTGDAKAKGGGRSGSPDNPGLRLLRAIRCGSGARSPPKLA